MIKQLCFFVCCFSLCVPFAHADVLPLDDALRATYIACVGIDDSLNDLKKMAGINTAITAVGTGFGAGATVVGIVKSSVDKQIENILSKVPDNSNLNPDSSSVIGVYDELVYETTNENVFVDKSKSLGHWRTGLLVGNAATNVAGAIIAGNNKVDGDLQTQINNCKSAVKILQDSIMQAKLNGEDVTEANEIVNACREFDYVDISSINNRAKVAMISSVAGATTGVVGVMSSAVVNSDVTRSDNTDSGKQKEKNLNTASNVLAAASTVASATATVFNATQISEIKKVATVAEKCTGVLK